MTELQIGRNRSWIFKALRIIARKLNSETCELCSFLRGLSLKFRQDTKTGMYFWGKSWNGVLLDTAASDGGCRGPEKWTSVATASPISPTLCWSQGCCHHPRLKAEAGEESAPWILGCQVRQYVLNIFICPFNIIPPESTRELLQASSTCGFHLLPQRPCVLIKDLAVPVPEDPAMILGTSIFTTGF